MIKKLEIKNFRGIKEGKIDLAPLTILLGPNNSGKTTILEALFLAPNPLRAVPYYPAMKTRYRHHTASSIIHSIHETIDSEGYAIFLHNYMDGKAEIECRLNGEDYILQFIKKEHKVHVCTNKEMVPSIINIDGKKYRNIGTLFSGSTDQNVSYSKNLIENTLLVSSNLIKMGFEYLKNNWASIINLGIAKKVVEDVSNLSYEKYIDITIEPFLGGRSAIYAYLEDGRRIRLGDLGEGIQNYIIAKMLYEIEKPKVLLWDDIESHFNPRMTLSIANWFSDLIEKGNQIVLTTHSLEAARTIASLNEEKARIYLTALDKNIFKTKSLALEEVEDLLKAGIDIRVAEPMLL